MNLNLPVSRKTKATNWRVPFLAVVMTIIVASGLGFFFTLFYGSPTVWGTIVGYSIAGCLLLSTCLLTIAFKLVSVRIKNRRVASVLKGILFIACLLMMMTILEFSHFIAITAFTTFPFLLHLCTWFLPIGSLIFAILVGFKHVYSPLYKSHLVKKANKIANKQVFPKSIAEMNSCINNCVYLNKMDVADKLSTMAVKYAEKGVLKP